MAYSRRLMRLMIGDEVLLRVFRGEVNLRLLDLPDDAEICGVYRDDIRLSFGLFIESRMFDPVPFGGEIPVLPPFSVEVRRND